MSTPAVRILSSQPGRFRGGRRHPASAEHPAGTFTEEQLAALEADPVFVVQRLETEEDDGTNSPNPSGGEGSGEKEEGASGNAPSSDQNTEGGADGAGGESANAAEAETPGTAGNGSEETAAAGTSDAAQGADKGAASEAGKAKDAATAAASSPPRQRAPRTPKGS